jgi:Biotin-lipoyl like
VNARTQPELSAVAAQSRAHSGTPTLDPGVGGASQASTNSGALSSPGALAGVLHLAQRAQGAQSVAELGFVMANETLSLLPYRQAAFFVGGTKRQQRLTTASGLVSVALDSPYALWLTRFVNRFVPATGVQRLTYAQTKLAAGPAWLEAWSEWLPDHVLVLPMHDNQGRLTGRMLYAREEPFTDADVALAQSLHDQYAYCLASLQQQPQGALLHLMHSLRSKGWWVLLALCLALFFPVRLSALAPAEVVALNALAVAAPQDGVVHKFHVQPNATVKAGDLLFSLDETPLNSRRDVANKGLAIANADALAVQQRAFDDLKSKGDLAAALGRVREKQSELALIDSALSRINVYADRAGVAVFGDANDWIGRTVQTGERVMQLADPNDAGVLVWLSAADALNLEPGAPIKLFLHTRPLQPLAAQLLQTSYQTVPGPDGISAYRLRATLAAPAAGEAHPRIGLRGTARVSGDTASLGYYLFRRPLAALREWTGL